MQLHAKVFEGPFRKKLVSLFRRQVSFFLPMQLSKPSLTFALTLAISEACRELSPFPLELKEMKKGLSTYIVQYRSPLLECGLAREKLLRRTVERKENEEWKRCARGGSFPFSESQMRRRRAPLSPSSSKGPITAIARKCIISAICKKKKKKKKKEPQTTIIIISGLPLSITTEAGKQQKSATTVL